MGYSIGGLRGDIKAKARASIAGHYQLPGGQSQTPKDIQESVRWLLDRSNFMFGGVDVKVHFMLCLMLRLRFCGFQKQAVDRQQAFMHPIIGDIIRAQWFGKGKADTKTMHRMVNDQSVPA